MSLIFLSFFIFISVSVSGADSGCSAAASSVSSEPPSVDYIKFIDDIELVLPTLIANRVRFIQPLIPPRSPLDIEAEDPFKERLTLEMARPRLREICCDHDAFSDKEKNLSLGDFELDLNFYLGHGDEGVVRLGRHKESGILVAVKAKERYRFIEKPKIAAEVVFLHKLGRLCGYFLVGNLGRFKELTDIILSPLALGENSYNLRYLLPKTIKTRFEIGHLFFRELFYLAQRGVYQVDQQLAHYITNSSGTEMCAVDFSGLEFAYHEAYLKKLATVKSYDPGAYKFSHVQTHILIGLLGGKLEETDELRKCLESASNYGPLKAMSEESVWSTKVHSLEEVFEIFRRLEVELCST